MSEQLLHHLELGANVEFAKAVNAEIVASVATTAGTRDANGVWTAVQAKPWRRPVSRLFRHAQRRRRLG